MKILSSIVLVVKNLKVELPFDGYFKDRNLIEEAIVGGEQDCPVSIDDHQAIVAFS